MKTLLLLSSCLLFAQSDTQMPQSPNDTADTVIQSEESAKQIFSPYSGLLTGFGGSIDMQIGEIRMHNQLWASSIISI